jgi:hypothetical protein
VESAPEERHDRAVVIDEAHRVAERGNPNRLNTELAKLLATR